MSLCVQRQVFKVQMEPEEKDTLLWLLHDTFILR